MRESLLKIQLERVVVLEGLRMSAEQDVAGCRKQSKKRNELASERTVISVCLPRREEGVEKTNVKG